PGAVRVALDRHAHFGQEVVEQRRLAVRAFRTRPGGAAVVGVTHDDVALVAPGLGSVRGGAGNDAVVAGRATAGGDERQAQVIGPGGRSGPYQHRGPSRRRSVVAAVGEPGQRVLTAEDAHGVERVWNRVAEEDVGGAGGDREGEVVEIRRRRGGERAAQDLSRRERRGAREEVVVL